MGVTGPFSKSCSVDHIHFPSFAKIVVGADFGIEMGNHPKSPARKILEAISSILPLRWPIPPFYRIFSRKNKQMQISALRQPMSDYYQYYHSDKFKSPEIGTEKVSLSIVIILSLSPIYMYVNLDLFGFSVPKSLAREVFYCDASKLSRYIRTCTYAMVIMKNDKLPLYRLSVPKTKAREDYHSDNNDNNENNEKIDNMIK